jgi:MoaA/NifB/PqqE/SkfB family radical SAM enzyme
VLIISGGEPSLHEGFTAIMKSGAHWFPSVTLKTNGTFIDAIYETISNYKNVLTVQISIDGTHDVHDAIRGKGVFDKAVNAVKKLVREGFKVTVSSTVHSKNI